MPMVWELHIPRLIHPFLSGRTRGNPNYNRKIYGEHGGKRIAATCTSQISNDDKQTHWHSPLWQENTCPKTWQGSGSLTWHWLWKGWRLALLVPGAQWLSTFHEMGTVLSIWHISSPDPYCISSELQTCISNCLLISIHWLSSDSMVTKYLYSRNGCPHVALSLWEGTYFNSKLASDLHIGILIAGLPRINSQTYD